MLFLQRSKKEVKATITEALENGFTKELRNT
jgi:hypothetical protein